MEDLYDRGALPKHELGNLWLFNEKAIQIAESLDRGDDGAALLAKTLMRVLKELDLVFEHTGLLDSGASSGPVREYYLLHEVWSRRFDEHDERGSKRRRMSAGTQALPCTYDFHTHIMIGRQMDVEGWLLPSFFRTFVCKCTTVLMNMSNVWGGGRLSLGRDALQWESKPRCDKEKPLALWLEQSEQKTVTIKVAGPGREKDLMRMLSVEMATILQDTAEQGCINIVDRRVGTLTSRSCAADDLVWVDEGEVERRLQNGEHAMKVFRKGRILTVSLYPFDPSASPSPNLDASRVIARKAHDSEFLLHCRSFNPSMTLPPPRWDEAKSIVNRVMDGHWGTSLFHRLLVGWEDLLGREQAKKHIQVLDVVEHGMRDDKGTADCQLFVTLPFRNLYFPIESLYHTVLTDFCHEVLKLFKVLRAKSAEATVRFLDERDPQSSGHLSAMDQGTNVSWENHTETEAILAFRRDYPRPPNGPGDPYPLDAETWFFLAESCEPRHMLIHGLDLRTARDSILSVKRDRIENGAAIGEKNKLKLSFSKSPTLEFPVEFQGFGAAQFLAAGERTLTLEMEYSAQVYEWSKSTHRWE